jgi:hypothetical protein
MTTRNLDLMARPHCHARTTSSRASRHRLVGKPDRWPLTPRRLPAAIRHARTTAAHPDCLRTVIGFCFTQPSGDGKGHGAARSVRMKSRRRVARWDVAAMRHSGSGGCADACGEIGARDMRPSGMDRAQQARPSFDTRGAVAVP